MTDHQWSLDILKKKIRETIGVIISIMLMAACSTTVNVPVNQEVAQNVVIPVDGKILEVDELGYIYIVDRSNRLLRYNEKFELTYEYSNDRLGAIKILDVNNPLKILVFYSNYQIVVALDNTLAETTRYDLNALEYSDITAVGISDDNFIWLYDPVQFRLIKINDGGNILMESNSLLSEKLEGIRPGRIVEKQNKIYLFDPEYGVILFDNYAKYLKRIELEKPDIVKVGITGSVHFEKANVIKSRNIGLASEEELIINSDELIRDFSITAQYVFLLTNAGLVAEPLAH